MYNPLEHVCSHNQTHKHTTPTKKESPPFPNHNISKVGYQRTKKNQQQNTIKINPAHIIIGVHNLPGTTLTIFIFFYYYLFFLKKSKKHDRRAMAMFDPPRTTPSPTKKKAPPAPQSL